MAGINAMIADALSAAAPALKLLEKAHDVETFTAMDDTLLKLVRALSLPSCFVTYLLAGCVCACVCV